jgi:hypothetical protein
MSNALRIAILVAGLIATGSASAVPIRASFSGAARGFTVNPLNGERTDFVAVPITGAFTFETIAPPIDEEGLDQPDRTPTSATYYFMPASISFDFRGVHSLFDRDREIGPGPRVILEDDGSTQSLTIAIGGPQAFANLHLADAARALFRDFDLTTFAMSAVDLAGSSLDFSTNVQGSLFSATFDHLRFDGVDSVSEPGLLLLGAIPLAFATLRRPRTRGASLRT